MKHVLPLPVLGSLEYQAAMEKFTDGKKSNMTTDEFGVVYTGLFAQAMQADTVPLLGNIGNFDVWFHDSSWAFQDLEHRFCACDAQNIMWELNQLGFILDFCELDQFIIQDCGFDQKTRDTARSRLWAAPKTGDVIRVNNVVDVPGGPQGLTIKQLHPGYQAWLTAAMCNLMKDWPCAPGSLCQTPDSILQLANMDVSQQELNKLTGLASRFYTITFYNLMRRPPHIPHVKPEGYPATPTQDPTVQSGAFDGASVMRKRARSKEQDLEGSRGGSKQQRVSDA